MIGKYRHERKQRGSLNKTPYEDRYEFFLGYNQSYTLVVFLNCLLFSCVVPLIPCFASLYFMIKYHVDRIDGTDVDEVVPAAAAGGASGANGGMGAAPSTVKMGRLEAPARGKPHIDQHQRRVAGSRNRKI